MKTHPSLDEFPDDVCLEILATLEAIEDIICMRRVSRRFNQLSRQHYVWSTAYRNHCWHLPGLSTHSASPSIPSRDGDLEKILIRAAKLNKNWASEHPTPLAHRRIQIRPRTRCIRIVHSHLAFVGYENGVCCYNLDQHVSPETAPEGNLCLWKEFTGGVEVHEMQCQYVVHDGRDFVNVVFIFGNLVRAFILELQMLESMPTSLVERLSLQFEPCITGPVCLRGDLVVLGHQSKGNVVLNLRSQVSFALTPPSDDWNSRHQHVLRRPFFAEDGVLFIESCIPEGRTLFSMYILPNPVDIPDNVQPLEPFTEFPACPLTATFSQYILNARFLGTYDVPGLAPGETSAHFLAMVVLDDPMPERRYVLSIMTMKISSKGILGYSFDNGDPTAPPPSYPLTLALSSSLRWTTSTNPIIFEGPMEYVDRFVALHHIQPEVIGRQRHLTTRLVLPFTEAECRTMFYIDLDEFLGRICVVTTPIGWWTDDWDTLHVLDYV